MFWRRKKRISTAFFVARCDKLLPDRMAPNKNWWASEPTRTNFAIEIERAREREGMAWRDDGRHIATTTTSCYNKNAQSTSRNPINHCNLQPNNANRSQPSNQIEPNGEQFDACCACFFFSVSLSLSVALFHHIQFCLALFARIDWCANGRPEKRIVLFFYSLTFAGYSP